MARPQEFDETDVLNRAMQVFWKKGYEATSISDLVAATGLNRGSLYNAFGDKAGLFSAVRQHYVEQSAARAVIEAAPDAPPRKTIEVFFNQLAGKIAGDPEHKGCLITNTVAELSARDAATAEWVQEIYRSLEKAFARLVERGQVLGEISTRRNPEALGRFLVGCTQGLILVGKANPESVADIARGALDALD